VQLLADHFASIPGVDVVDAPFSGGPHDIAAGHVTLFAGGEEAALARVRPLLAAYADPFLAVGPRGAGQQVKLVNNALFAAHLGLLSEAVRLAGDFGVAEPVLLSALTHASGASRALAIVAARGSVAGFAGTAREFLVKDLDVVRQVAAAQQADLGALDPPITRLADIVLAAVD
jgi:3-hydroxyisobutyrate dehydrogenase-like beta-hydroxyacid dehydrogenase